MAVMDGMGAPPGPFDYAVVAAAGGTVVLSILLCLKHLLRPAEKASDHIKRRVLEDRAEP